MHIKQKFFNLLQSSHRQILIKRKNKRNKALRLCSLIALIISLGCPICILFSILINAYSALTVTKILLPIEISTNFTVTTNPGDLRYQSIRLLNNSLNQIFAGYNFKDSDEILSRNSYKELENFIIKQKNDSCKYEIWFTASSIMNAINKEKYSDEHYIALLDILKETGRVRKFFNKSLFVKSDSREPENAGILGALIGSIMTIIVCLTLALPMGIMSGIYLYEFMPKNSFITNIVEISISNLAAVPSIIFGVVGLTLYLGILGLPRSSPFVGGMTLSFIMLPNIVIATKNSFANIPIVIKDAAFALGASHIKVILDHSLPIALPRIIHGIVLAIARILGESSPLIMIGMVAFIADTPNCFFDPATVLPVQIYIWSSSPEIAFIELAAIAIIALLLVLFALNLIANFVKKKFEFFNF
ncbi:PstA family ABC transporter permease [Wolbachia endosymbiont of Howardula sp.]|uniref:PstA family ABC transporter permease n=1 Tax=Wolbachia endosymbiont of Howardula sp. TaxID=2916816 RepID=UPI00217DF2BC|nr:PstA family ABC transporter permease [Wolbachia endosymbiont of Howardula sp.]UWI83201.1 phosphate ABC transporter permease PstA [Wolbachia endosymbiont of Howardula sp.]